MHKLIRTCNCVHCTTTHLYLHTHVFAKTEKPKSVERGAGDKVVFGTVLLAGTREWTLLGKPTCA